MCPACKRQKKVKNISIPVQRFNFPFLNHNQLENVHLSTNGQCKAPHETKWFVNIVSQFSFYHGESCCHLSIQKSFHGNRNWGVCLLSEQLLLYMLSVPHAGCFLKWSVFRTSFFLLVEAQLSLHHWKHLKLEEVFPSWHIPSILNLISPNFTQLLCVSSFKHRLHLFVLFIFRKCNITWSLIFYTISRLLIIRAVCFWHLNSKQCAVCILSCRYSQHDTH